MRYFYLRAQIEQRQGADANWDKLDNLMMALVSEKRPTRT
jgi:hypothetical protein